MGSGTQTATQINYTPSTASSDVITLTYADQLGDTTTNTIAVTVDAGPTATPGTLTIGHGQTESITSLINGLTTPGLPGDVETLTTLSAANGATSLVNGAVTYTAPTNGEDTISYTLTDQLGDTTTGAIAVAVDTGPTTKTGALTINHGQTENITSLLNGLIAPGQAGDTETLTAVTATTGTISLKNGVATYIAPANGTGSISYTVTDQIGDAATGAVAVTVDPGPAAANGVLTLAHGQTANITAALLGLATPGLSGDVETITALTASGGTATLTNGVTSFTPAASGQATVDYTVTDQNGASASGALTVTADPGPIVKNATLSIITGAPANITSLLSSLVSPGLTGDAENLVSVSAANGNITHATLMGSGTQTSPQINYNPSTASSDAITFTYADQYGDTATGTIAVTERGPSLTIAAALSLIGTNVIGFVTISDVAAQISNLTSAQIAALAALNVQSITATSGTILLNAAQITALDSAKIAFTGNPTILVTDTAANLKTLTTLPSSAHFILVTPSAQGALSLTIAQAIELASSTTLAPVLPNNAIIAIADTPANISALTAGELTTLTSAGFKTIAANAPTVIDAAEAALLAKNLITITGAKVTISDTIASISALTASLAATYASDGYAITVADTAAHIEALTTKQMKTLTSLHVGQIFATDSTIALTTQQAISAQLDKIAFTAPNTTTATVEIVDTTAHVSALTSAQISGLATLGVTQINVSGGTLALTVAQITAIETAKTVAIHGPSLIAIVDTPANLRAIAGQTLSPWITEPTILLPSTSAGNVVMSVALASQLAAESPSALTLANGATMSISDTAANIDGNLNPTLIAALAKIGVHAVAASDAGISLSISQALAYETGNIPLGAPTQDKIVISTTAAQISALTATQISGFKALNISAINASNAPITLTTQQALAAEVAAITFASPVSSFPIDISDAAKNIETLTAAQITSLSKIGVSGLLITDAAISYTMAQTQAALTAGLTLGAAGPAVITENFANGVYAKIQISSPTYSPKETIYTSAGATIAMAQTSANASTAFQESGTLNIYDSATTIAINGAALATGKMSVASNVQTFQLQSHVSESIMATGTSGDAFNFTQHFGNDSLTGFAASGKTPDSLEFNASAFGAGLTSAHQANDLAALLAHLTQNAAGNAVITDLYGDTLTFIGVHKSALTATAAAGDFHFL